MRVILDTPNPAMEPDQIAEINSNNTKKTQQAINKTGVNVICDITQNTQFTFNSATYATIGQMEKAFTASGGLIEISFQATVTNGTPVTCLIKLIVDSDEKKARIIKADCAAAINSSVYIFYKEVMGAGKHSVKVQALTGGAVAFCGNDTVTELSIVEYLF